MSDIRNRLIAMGASGALLLAGVVAYNSEGERRHAYRDPVGIWTVCIGHTRAVQPERLYTEAECSKLFLDDLRAADAQVGRLVKVPVSDSQRAALIDFEFNTGALSGSTLLRKINARDPQACNEYSRWVYADGVKLPGLITRRDIERRLCTS